LKTLDLIIPNLNLTVHGDSQIEILGITADSRTVNQGDLYAAIKGTLVDGHDYIESAIQSGATAILHSDPLESYRPGICYLQAQDVPETLGQLLYEFNDRCLDDLIVVGTTGTNGKTTVSTLLFDLFTQLGYKCGLISTVTVQIAGETRISTHTTPDAVALHALFKDMLEAGCTHVFMEVSSHAIHQKRIAGVPFFGAIFTNITHDHLDYHGTFDEYIKAKKMFFDGLKDTAFSLTNKDDRNGLVMLQNTRATRYTYGLNGTADFNAKIWECDFSGMHLRLFDKDIWSPLIGRFNAYNMMAVYAAATLITEGNEEIEVAMSALKRVSGRFETIAGPGNRTVIIDYAHTPDALENVIATIQEIQKNASQLICVVGCGGNRDAEKRPKMGRIASQKSQRCIFTSDNPRNEDPNTIISEMMLGVATIDSRKVLKITDRAEAIKTAIALSFPGDVILIAGKGHETYQETNGLRIEFDDRIWAQNALNDIS
jgi:UDP-N-acetylmuramoyl-L-alanyl-D-glutamate--2,6-diaminopimelate ligase